jgi:hypothetical protein
MALSLENTFSIIEIWRVKAREQQAGARRVDRMGGRLREVTE